jgi:hypothetical protein
MSQISIDVYSYAYYGRTSRHEEHTCGPTPLPNSRSSIHLPSGLNMTRAEQMPLAPSLRTTRSRVNPTVTLYSLDPPTVASGGERHATAATTALPDATEPSKISNRSGEKSRFFSDDPGAVQRVKRESDIEEKTALNGATPRKRRKLIDEGVEDAAQAKSASPVSSSSSLSPPPQHEEPSSRATVKPEPPATPSRRSTRAHKTPQTYTIIKTERDMSPLKSVKDESATPARTPRIKKESTAKPRPSTPIKLKLDKPHPEPPRWRRQYELIEKMREKIVAPVDTLYVEHGPGQ